VLVVEHSWLTKPLEEVSEPPAETAAEPLAETSAEPFAAPPALEIVAPVDAFPPPEAFPAEPVADAPTLVPSPVSLVPAEPPFVVEALAPAGFEQELDLDLPVAAADPAPAPGPAPVELPDLPAFPPVPDLPAAVLPDLPAPPPLVTDTAPVAEEAEKKVPFYKRELSRKPKAEKAPKEARAKRARPAKAEGEPGDKVPFYKRDFSLKRGPKEWDAAEPASEPKPKSKSKAISVPRFSMPKLALPSRPRAALPGLPGTSSKKIVGLKIGGSQIAAALVNNGPSPELVQAVRVPLEHGVVVGGELRDPEALAIALRDFFKLHKLPKRGVRLGIANNRIGVRTFEVTGIDDPKQLANAIRFRAQEVLPIPLEEAVLDYQVLSQSVNEEGQHVTRVLLVVAYRELVDRYVYACKKAGLQIVGIDLEAFALLRAVAEPHDPVAGSERGALVAVAVGHDRSTFAVSDGRVCEFTRVLEWGGWALNVAIARALDTSPSEAEPIKRALSFGAQVAVPEGINEEHLAIAQEAARRQLQTFARELVSSLQFYQNQPGSLGIGEIVLTGGTAHLPGLGAELERLVGVPVRVADPLTRLRVSKRAGEQEQLGSLAVAIGLGIDD
jgi:type IV pilus assembly protein PilM